VAATTSFACLEMRSSARGYLILNTLTRGEGVQVLEATPVDAGRFMILVEGDQAQLAKVIDEIQRRGSQLLIDLAFITNPHAGLKSSIYSLETHPLEEALLVVETETASRAIAIAHTLMSEHDVRTIELKVGRGLRGTGLAFFTGSMNAMTQAKKIAEDLLRASARNGTVELVEQPTAGFRSFFNLSGE
jgi:hypothetical protein